MKLTQKMIDAALIAVWPHLSVTGDRATATMTKAIGAAMDEATQLTEGFIIKLVGDQHVVQWKDDGMRPATDEEVAMFYASNKYSVDDARSKGYGDRMEFEAEQIVGQLDTLMGYMKFNVHGLPAAEVHEALFKIREMLVSRGTEQ